MESQVHLDFVDTSPLFFSICSNRDVEGVDQETVLNAGTRQLCIDPTISAETRLFLSLRLTLSCPRTEKAGKKVNL